MSNLMSLDRAIQIATRAHSGQIDKQGEPYILHPLRVMFDLFDPQDKIIGVLADINDHLSRVEGLAEPERFRLSQKYRNAQQYLISIALQK